MIAIGPQGLETVGLPSPVRPHWLPARPNRQVAVTVGEAILDGGKLPW